MVSLLFNQIWEHCRAHLILSWQKEERKRKRERDRKTERLAMIIGKAIYTCSHS